MDRFNTTKEELSKLGSEFSSDALPLLEKLYTTSFWILHDKKATKKIILQTYSEVIDYCDKTKAYADWWGFVHRIWMREIQDFSAPIENDVQTKFDFIDFTEVTLTEATNIFNNNKFNSISVDKGLSNALNKLPSILRIPLILKELHSLKYDKIAELIDIPDGVVATRIYRSRKLLFMFLRDNFNYEEQKKIGLPDNFNPVIFGKRRCALFVDDELSAEESSEFKKIIETESNYKNEILIQEGIKKLFKNFPIDLSKLKRIKSKIERKAYKRFVKI
jgi:DNA-directed RNA polymerase specialized sigma24 family protein